MQEELIGQGVLRSGDHPGAKEWNVNYKFLITATVVKTSGPRRVGVQRNSVGSVSAVNGDEILAGFYELKREENGEILKVQNFGLGRWTIRLPR